MPDGKALLVTDVVSNDPRGEKSSLWTDQRGILFTMAANTSLFLSRPLIIFEGETICPQLRGSSGGFLVTGQLVDVAP